jgi:phage shock protein PspC (stress-responsive transcriptional regulator)
MTTQKKLTRSTSNRKIAGVCGGLGEYFNMDPLVFRIIFLVLLLGGGSGFLLYLIFWIVMPENRTYENNTPYTTFQESEIEDINSNSPNKKMMKNSSGFFWGLLLVTFGLLWLGRTFGLFHFYWYNVIKLWPLLIICLGISLLPIERLWKNVCHFFILALAILLLFVLPASSCHYHFWDDDFSYEFRKKFKDSECTINDRTTQLIQKEIQISDPIKGVIIEGAWDVTITQDDTNNSASIEYNVPERKVTTELRPNGYLYIRVSSGGGYSNKTLKATINAASLEKIKASGATNIKTYGEFTSHCDISLSGASKLRNFTLKGDYVDIDISGASKIDFDNIHVNRFKVDASGASNINGSGYAAETSVSGSGASHIRIFDMESETLYVSLSGASSAEATVNQTIKGTLSGASKLRYKNAENVSGVSTTGGSKIIKN